LLLLLLLLLLLPMLCVAQQLGQLRALGPVRRAHTSELLQTVCQQNNLMHRAGEMLRQHSCVAADEQQLLLLLQWMQ
jgi:hypothetical protein